MVHNRAQFCDSIVKNFFAWLPDKLYLSLRYHFKMGRWIDWKNPKTFTEKIQWLKVYNRKPVYTTMVDKYAVKQYVSNLIGREFIIPTLGVWDRAEDIEWDSLPEQFVLKTTHGGGSGGVVICKNKFEFDRCAAIAKLNESMSSDIYSNLREWPYKNVRKRILAEKLIAFGKESVSTELWDYKFFCFNGEVRFFKVDFGRFVEHHANYYSPDGKLLDFGEADFAPVPCAGIVLPKNLKEMVVLAEQLSKGESFLRVDLYNVDGKIYFGELTFYPAGGMGKWTSDDVDRELGEYLRLQ